MNGAPKLFFITGLPRSRTAWLANFFTHGRAFCLHDGLQHCEGPEDLIGLLETHRGFGFAGNSDSLLPLFAPALVKLRPEARWLHVGRPWEDAAASYLKAFTKELLPGVPLPTMDSVTRSFQRLYPALLRLCKVVPRGCYHYISFKDLSDQMDLKDAWEHLLPGERWPGLRWQLLDKLKVTVKADKVKYNRRRLERLMKQVESKMEISDLNDLNDERSDPCLLVR